MTRLATATVGLALTLALALASAQPYAADGGFSRPREGFSVTRAHLAAVVDAGAPRVLIGDASGARVLTLRPGEPLEDAPSVTLAEASVVRGVAAADGWQGGAAVYAWHERDATSGVYRYWWSWQGERRALLESLQDLHVTLALGPDGPEAYVAVPGVAGGRLDRRAWDEATPSVHVRSDSTLAEPTATYDADGVLHLAYLEGATVDTPIGPSSEWALVYRRGDAEVARFDGALGPPSPVVLHADASTAVVAWSREDGTVLAMTLDADDAAAVSIGSGRAFGAGDGRLLWTRAGSLIATDLHAPSPDERISVNLAWSPHAVARASSTRADGVTYLVWTGTEPGGGSRALVSDDAAPFEPTWRDHVAAWFGWTPWAFAEELAGQATGALLVGVLGTMALMPLLWLLTLPLSRRVGDRSARTLGAALAVALVAALGAAAVARAAIVGNDAWDLLAGGWGFALALVAGLVLTPVLLRRVDLDVQPALLVSSAIATFVSLSLIAFIAFQPWLQVLGM